LCVLCVCASFAYVSFASVLCARKFLHALRTCY
jgi:hypothetical protein